MKWLTQVEVIDVDTGELLVWDKKHIKENYIILRTDKLNVEIITNQSGYIQHGIKKFRKLVKLKKTQLKLL